MLLFNKFDLIRAISQVLDMVNTTLLAHHLRTAYLADQLCRRLDLERREHNRVVLSAMLHDLGIVPLGLKADDLLFERDLDIHSRAGWMMLRSCPQLQEEAWLIRYHHLSWQTIVNLPERRRRSGTLANIVSLADYLDISSRTQASPRSLRSELKAMAGRLYKPEYVEAARDLLFTPNLLPSLGEASRHLVLPPTEDLAMSEADTTAFAHLFSRLIDSRSPFTALHSAVVGSLSVLLYRLAKGREKETQPIYLAGLLHDVGKLGVPLELIEKNGPLSADEFSQVSEHARLSYQTLLAVPGFQKVAFWGGCHHERLNGSGYPWGLTKNDIQLEARIIAVADVLTALLENRPYRPGLPAREALDILRAMAKSQDLDSDLVWIVHRNLSQFNDLRFHTHQENRAFLQGLASDIRASVKGKRSRVWQQVLNNSLPLSV